jgi:hypothetical protein
MKDERNTAYASLVFSLPIPFPLSYFLLKLETYKLNLNRFPLQA